MPRSYLEFPETFALHSDQNPEEQEIKLCHVAFGPVARSFFPSKINEAQRCQLSPFSSHSHRLSAACQFNTASLQCSGTVPIGKGWQNWVQEFL